MRKGCRARDTPEMGDQQMRVYVASSWRNTRQPEVVAALLAAGHHVYDFRQPAPGDYGFHWSEIDPEWKGWTMDAYLNSLTNPIADAGFGKDMEGLNGADVTVLVLPCGRSAHLEAGYAAGQGKPVVILLDETFEPELMYKMAYRCVTTLEEAVATLGELAGHLPVGHVPTWWNGEPCRARQVQAVVADNCRFKRYWARDEGILGHTIRAVEVTYGGHVFYLDDRDGSGWMKVTVGRGSPEFGHGELAVSHVEPLP